MTRRTYYSLSSFLSYLTRFKLRFGFVLVWFVIANVFLAIIPVFVGKLIGVLATSPINQAQAYQYVWILIICSVGHTITWHMSEFAYLKFLQPLGFEYENIVFKQVIQKPYHFFVNKFSGKVSAYVGILGEELRNFVTNILYNYTSEIVRMATISIVLLSVNIMTGSIFVVGLLLMFVVGRHTISNSARYEKLATDTQSTKTGKIIDAIANFVNVKSFQKETQEIATIQHEQQKTIAAARKSSLWNMFFWGSMGFVVRVLIWPVTILLNTYLFLEHKISIAEFTTFMTSVLLFSDFVWGVIWNVSQFNLKLARIEEAHQYLFGNVNTTKLHFSNQPPNQHEPIFSNSLELQGLTFTYPDKNDTQVLSDIKLIINKGDKIGIVGKSGSGKSTLTKLLIGYYPSDEGQLLLDSQPITTSLLSKLISYVPQDTTLFHRSIADNIAYASDRSVTRAEIIQASKQAHAHEFITKIGKGYASLVGERGVKLSAGQRQRIAIARAFLDNKPILVLDEATSALDSESELYVQEALEKLWQEKTVIAIAHRLSTLRHMDKVIVMDDGRIIENGTHEELLAKKGMYAKLWAHQSGGFLEE